jgi:hypothetical protein
MKNEKRTCFETSSLKTTSPACTQNRANWRGDNTCHCISLTYVDSKFAKRAIPFADLPSLQTCSAVTTLPGISRAPTSVVRVGAQKNVRCRAQGNVVSSEKSAFFCPRSSCKKIWGRNIVFRIWPMTVQHSALEGSQTGVREQESRQPTSLVLKPRHPRRREYETT